MWLERKLEWLVAAWVIWAAIGAVAVGSGCATEGDETLPVVGVSGSPEADEEEFKADGETGPVLPNDIHYVRHSAEYRAAFLQAYGGATARLERMVEEESLEEGTWAVALDGDETVWSNALYEQERALLGLGYTRTSWGRWVRSKRATALPGAVAFLRRVHELGGRVAIVTNRTRTECPYSEQNAREIGLEYDVMLCKVSTSEKEARWRAIEAGTASPTLPPLRVVMWVGDNIQDFPDLDQELRRGDDAAFADFGDQFVMLPNPMYGSWERNPVE
jgi:5'-nucleotidase (lipoprotein e(P4) family)